MGENLRANLWVLADAVGCTVERAGNALVFGTKRFVKHEGLEIPVTLNCASSAIVGEDAVVWCRCLGNLTLMFATNYREGSPVSCFAIDLAKLNARPDMYLEAARPKTVQEPVRLLGAGVTRTWHKGVDHRWAEEK